MFGLATGPCCGVECEPCELFLPPMDPQADCPWDVLTVEHSDATFILRRCTLVSTPLDSAVAGYASGATIPYYQPNGTGPPLGNTAGVYSVSATRIPIIAGGGITTENDDDCNVVDPGDGGAFALPVDGSCTQGATYAPPSIISPWTNYGESHPVMLRSTQADADGKRFAVYLMASNANFVEASAPPFKIAVFDLDGGTGWTYIPTQAGLLSLSNASDSFLDPAVGAEGAGSRISIGKDRMVTALRWVPSDREVHFMHLPFDRTVSNGGWLTTDLVSVTKDSYEDARVPVAYCWDDSNSWLEMKYDSTADTSSVWACDTTGKSVLLRDDIPSAGIPFCYQRRGRRHMFLLDTTAPGAGTRSPLGSFLYDIDESGSQCGPPQVRSDFDGKGRFCNISPRGEQMLLTNQAGGTNDARIYVGDWEMSATSLRSSCSITCEGYFGWVHVRGVRIVTTKSLGHPGILLPGQGSVNSQGSNYSDDSESFSIHPSGPTSGLAIGRQFSADNVGQSGVIDPTDGTEILQFVGEKYLGSLDSYQDQIERMPVNFSPDAFFSDSNPRMSYAWGVVAAPVPSNYGPGANADY